MLARLVRIVLALAVLALPAAAQDVVFTGQVTYRERVALPENAELRVTLVTLPGGRPVVGAAASITAGGRVPVAFTLNVRSGVAKAGGSFGLVAEIRSQGRTLFQNWQPVPVDVAAPAPVRIVVQFSPDPPLIIEPPVEPANPLLDTAWRVTSIGGDPAPADAAPTLAIAADQRVGGSGGCNNYFTEASFEEAPLAFGPVAATRMACAPDVNAREIAFFAALAAVAGYELVGDGLQLLDPAGVALVGLIRTP